MARSNNTLREEEKDPNYLPVFGTLVTSPHPNADNLQIGKLKEAPGFTFIVSKSLKEGDLGVFYPANSRIEEYIFNDPNFETYRNFLNKNRRVTAIKLRTVISDGIFVPFSLLDSILPNIDLSKVRLGEPLFEVPLQDGTTDLIGRRYLPPFRQHGAPGSGANRAVSRPKSGSGFGRPSNPMLEYNLEEEVRGHEFIRNNKWVNRFPGLAYLVRCFLYAYMFFKTRVVRSELTSELPLHKNTAFFERSYNFIQDAFKNDSVKEYSVTSKMHGTSHRIGCIYRKVTRFRPNWENGKFSWFKTEEAPVFVQGSRKVFLGEVDCPANKNKLVTSYSRNDSYYNDPFRNRALGHFQHNVIENFCLKHKVDVLIYGEIVGFAGTAPIMSGGCFEKDFPAWSKALKRTGTYHYSYGCWPGSSSIYSADNEFYVYHFEIRKNNVVVQDADLYRLLKADLEYVKVKFVPSSPVISDVDFKAGVLSDDDRFTDDLKKRIDIIDPMVKESEVPYPYEGIVLKMRIDDEYFFYKLKSNSFKIAEGIKVDLGIPEETQEEETVEE